MDFSKEIFSNQITLYRGVGVRIILKWMFWEWGLRVLIGFTWLGIGRGDWLL
jgi:hypothetical protein